MRPISCLVTDSILIAIASAACIGSALALDASTYCAASAGHRAAAPAPEDLLPAVAKAFHIGADVARQATTIRCAGSKLLACYVGANLNCGQADTRRSLPGATAFCRDNAGADSIPMVATGHDTIFDWRCVGRRAVAGKQNMAVDPQGYIALIDRAMRRGSPNRGGPS
jgi:hypothetical protein